MAREGKVVCERWNMIENIKRKNTSLSVFVYVTTTESSDIVGTASEYWLDDQLFCDLQTTQTQITAFN